MPAGDRGHGTMQFRQVMRNTESARAGCWFNNAFRGAGRKIRMRNYFLSASQELVRLTDVWVRLPSSLTRRFGDAMRASQKSKRKRAKASRTFAHGSSPLSMATRRFRLRRDLGWASSVSARCQRCTRHPRRSTSCNACSSIELLISWRFRSCSLPRLRWQCRLPRKIADDVRNASALPTND